MLTASVTYSSNYLPADGRMLSVGGNHDLFTLIGTTFGGDGVNNFFLPDLRSAAPNNTLYLVCVGGIFP